MFRSRCLSLLILLGAIAAVSAVTVRKSSAKVLVGEIREGEDVLKVDIQADGEVHQLRMKPADNILAEDAKIVTVRYDGHGKAHFEQTAVADLSRNYRIYQDDEAKAVLGFEGNNIFGFIGHLITVKTEGNKHYLYRSDGADENMYEHDFLMHPKAENLPEVGSANMTIPPIVNVSRQLGPLCIDVLPFVDSVRSASLGNDASVLNYLVTLWSAVNQRYTTITSPSMTVRIVGAGIIRTAADEPFITPYIVNGYLLGANTLYSFGSWVGQHLTSLRIHDVAYLHTGRDLINSDGSTGLAGIAFMSCACPYYFQYSYNGVPFSCAVALGEAWNSYTVNIAAHEIGHNIGAPHDGDYGATGCLASSGYIMAPYLSTGPYSNTFSTCSASSIAAYAQTLQGRSCLPCI